MARRRLSPLPGTTLSAPEPGALALAECDVPRAELAAASGAQVAVPPAAHGPAPIARVAAEAAAASAFEEMAETLRAAREGGRMVLDLPLDSVAPDHLLRDRIAVEDEEMATLKASIRVHGQRAPIEVTPREGSLPYGLISGWRRLAALRALHAETGEARFAAVRALVTRPESVGAAYVAMVEENELRVGLSQYERARVAVLAARRGVFESENAALHALFAGASRAKLSRIRAFLALVHALDGVLHFPQAIPERLGLALAERLRSGAGPEIAAVLAAESPATAEAELALLTRLAAPPRPSRTPSRNTGAAAEEILPGVRLDARRAGTTLTLTLRGKGVTPALEAAVRAAVAGLGRPDDTARR
jgi:ParB family transcriptional regulator, chromosome partitioning protein